MSCKSCNDTGFAKYTLEYVNGEVEEFEGPCRDCSKHDEVVEQQLQMVGRMFGSELESMIRKGKEIIQSFPNIEPIEEK